MAKVKTKFEISVVSANKLAKGRLKSTILEILNKGTLLDGVEKVIVKPVVE